MARIILPNSDYRGVDTTAAPDSVTLVATIGKNYIIRNSGTGGNALTVNYGSYILSLADGQTMKTEYDGANWTTDLVQQNVIAENIIAETLESTVATGTAPLTVASTTKVTNLNADLLDGKSGPTGTIVGTSDTQTLTNKTLTNPSFGSSTIETAGKVTAGLGGGGITLNVNDGQGNANVTFNHDQGIPEQDGNSARIVVNTDTVGSASMLFELASSVTEGVSVNPTTVLSLGETNSTLLGSTIWTAGNDGPGSGLNADKLDGADLSTSTALGTSNTLVPSQNAVKVYVDNSLSGGGVLTYEEKSVNFSVTGDVTTENRVQVFRNISASDITMTLGTPFTSAITMEPDQVAQVLWNGTGWTFVSQFDEKVWSGTGGTSLDESNFNYRGSGGFVVIAHLVAATPNYVIFNPIAINFSSSLDVDFPGVTSILWDASANAITNSNSANVPLKRIYYRHLEPRIQY